VGGSNYQQRNKDKPHLGHCHRLSWQGEKKKKASLDELLALEISQEVFSSNMEALAERNQGATPAAVPIQPTRLPQVCCIAILLFFLTSVKQKRNPSYHLWLANSVLAHLQVLSEKQHK